MKYKSGFLFVVSALLLPGCSIVYVWGGARPLTCGERLQAAQKANVLASQNFTNAYAFDVEGAEAELLLIENKGPGSFATDVNYAEGQFAFNLRAAIAARCDTTGYPLSPIAEFKQRLEHLKAGQRWSHPGGSMMQATSPGLE